MRIPRALADEWKRESAWLAELPRLLADCAERWGLDLEEPVDTPHSLVVPAGEVVLKLNAPSHFEADHEADALASWDGTGAVRLLARDDARRAFVCERCRPGTELWNAEADEQDVIAGLLPRLRLEPTASRQILGPAPRLVREQPERMRGRCCDGQPSE